MPHLPGVVNSDSQLGQFRLLSSMLIALTRITRTGSPPFPCSGSIPLRIEIRIREGNPPEKNPDKGLEVDPDPTERALWWSVSHFISKELTQGLISSNEQQLPCLAINQPER